MADSSFDIVSKIDRQEVDNALSQAAREISQRFDFKGTGAEIKWAGDEAIEISASAEDRATAVLEVFKEKLIKRQQSLKILDAGEPRASGRESKISIALKEGISTEDAKKVGKLIRDEGPKGVKVQVQGDELRVSSKKRDDLQAVQALVKSQDYDFAVQFTNYRDLGCLRRSARCDCACALRVPGHPDMRMSRRQAGGRSERDESLHEGVAQVRCCGSVQVVGDGSFDGEGDDRGLGVAFGTGDLDGQLVLEQGFHLRVEAGVPFCDARRPCYAGVDGGDQVTHGSQVVNEPHELLRKGLFGDGCVLLEE